MSPIHKLCTACSIFRPLDLFHNAKRGAFKRYSVCKLCKNKRSEAYRVEHKSYFALKARKWRTLNNDKFTNSQRDYYQRHKSEHNESSMRRYWRIRCATTPWANRFFIAEAYRLARLRTKCTGMLWSVDHIVPISGKLVCGLHVENNIRVVLNDVNKYKSNITWPDMPD